jgi:glycosyltransferase involved in cell wall biosynthesis
MKRAEGRAPGLATGLTNSIVICCYQLERWHDVCAAVNSVLAQEPTPDEVIVVADHNPRLKSLLEATFPTVLVVDNRYARGLSGARNTGIAVSSGDLIVFMDDDAVLEPGMIATLCGNMQNGQLLGAVARIEPLWLAPPPKWFPDEFLWVVGCTYRGMKPGRVRNLIGAAMCIRRGVFDVVGGFTDGIGRARSRLPLGCEETELCIRANAAHSGSWFVYDPSSVCRHKVPPRRMTWRYFAARCYAEGWSKAHIGARLRSEAALSSERSYVTGVLLQGFVRGCRDFLTRADAHALLNAIAIALGLSVTSAGYLAATVALVMDRALARSGPAEDLNISKSSRGN